MNLPNFITQDTSAAAGGVGGGLFSPSSQHIPLSGAGGVGIGYPGRARDAVKKKHFLRQRQKKALIRMIEAAVPLDSGGGGANGEGEDRSDATSSSPTPNVTVNPGRSAPPPTYLAPPYPTGETESTTLAPPLVWRLLIFDDWGRDIIAPLLKVSELRELGVTLYLHLQTDRGPVPGTPALYFCAPTVANLERITADTAGGLYDWVHIHFTAPIPRERLEGFARGLCRAGLPSVSHLRVVDERLSYVALAEDCFELARPRSFGLLHRAAVPDAVVRAHLEEVSEGLSHVVLSLGGVPVLAHARTAPATALARRVAQQLQDAVRERHATPTASGVAATRPVLVVVDRASDLAPALHHPFSYRGLLVDEAGMRLNKCAFQTEEGRSEVFEVDVERDAFYAAHAGDPFGELSRQIEMALREYQAAYAALAASAGAAAHRAEDSDASAVSRLLASAPGLAERKRFLDLHTQLAYSFLRQIRSRGLDRLHGVELGLLRRGPLDKEEFARLLRERVGTTADRQRLFLIAHLLAGSARGEDSFVQQQLPLLAEEAAESGARVPNLTPHPPSTHTAYAKESKEHHALLATVTAPSEKAGMKEPGVFPALNYLRRLRNWSAPGEQRAEGGTGNAASLGWGFAQQLAKNLVHTLGSAAEDALPLTRLVEALLQDPEGSGVASSLRSSVARQHPSSNTNNLLGSAGGGGGRRVGSGEASPTSIAHGGQRAKMLDDLVGLDPSSQRTVNLAEFVFSQVIVFVLGGGSIAEYDELQRWGQTQGSKTVLYGCTSFVSGEEMLRELNTLGEEVE